MDSQHIPRIESGQEVGRPVPARLDQRDVRNPQVRPQTEAYCRNVTPVGPRVVYDEAKRFAEPLTVTCRRMYGAHAAIVRVFNTRGSEAGAHDFRSDGPGETAQGYTGRRAPRRSGPTAGRITDGQQAPLAAE
ncbi:GDP-mannose 4,6-dehydratase [Streptomyces sp. NPDC004270]